MNILIVEDEKTTLAYLAKGFKENGFTVETANTGADGLHLMKECHFDIIVLDVMLPDITGWELLSQLRQHNTVTPVIFLTACDSTNDKIKGLRMGSDDYLVKPFSFTELQLRVDALLRRKTTPIQSTLNVADLEINLLKHEVTRDKQTINLTQKEFSLLELLCQQPGRVLTRTQIAEKVWGIHFDCDTNVIDVAIRRLRLKIDADFKTKLIQTKRGAGYFVDANSM